MFSDSVVYKLIYTLSLYKQKNTENVEHEKKIVHFVFSDKCNSQHI